MALPGCCSVLGYSHSGFSRDYILKLNDTPSPRPLSQPSFPLSWESRKAATLVISAPFFISYRGPFPIPFPVLLPMSFRGAAEESRRPITNPHKTRRLLPKNSKSFEGARGNFYKSSPAVPPAYSSSTPGRTAAGPPPSPRLTAKILTPHRRRPPGRHPLAPPQNAPTTSIAPRFRFHRASFPVPSQVVSGSVAACFQFNRASFPVPSQLVLSPDPISNPIPPILPLPSHPPTAGRRPFPHQIPVL